MAAAGGEHGVESRSLEVAGLRMRWEEQGEGQPVVLLHGLPTSPRLWRHVVPRLEGVRALAWELVGYGGSIAAGRGRDLSVARQAEYLAAWMRALGLESAVLVGHDLGGGVAQILAVRSPELVRGLVLVDSIAYDSWPIPEVRALRSLSPLVDLLPDTAFALLFRVLVARGHDSPACAEESIAAHWPYYVEGGGASALVRQVRFLDQRDTLAIADRLPALRAPARLVWGAADPYQRIGTGYRLAYELRAPLDRIEGGRHFVPEDHPDRVAAGIVALLEELAGR